MRSPVGPLIALLLSAPWMVAAQEAAVPSKQACKEHYEDAQVHRRSGRLLDARADLLVCVNAACPQVVAASCMEWLEQLQAELPSLLFTARQDGRDVDDVAVLVDGKEVARHLDGRPFELDPGGHVVRFERRGSTPIEQRIVVNLGDRNRVVTADFLTPPPKPLQVVRPIPWGAWALAGAAVVAFGGAATFYAMGFDRRQQLERECKPFCTDSELSDLRLHYGIADVSLGLGLLSTAGALAVFILRPSRTVGGAASSWSIESSPNQLGLRLCGTF